jgi:hypothetical protein
MDDNNKMINYSKMQPFKVLILVIVLHTIALGQQNPQIKTDQRRVNSERKKPKVGEKPTTNHDADMTVAPPFDSNYKIGDVCSQCEVADGTREYQGLRAAELKGKLCFINTQNKLVIPPMYDYEVSSFGKYARFEDGFCQVKKGGFVGMIDLYNNVIIPFEYKNCVYNPSSRHIIVTSDTGTGLFDEFGRQLIPCIYQELQNISGYNEYFQAKKGGKFGIVTIDNKILLPFEHDKIQWLPERNVFLVNKNDKYGMANLQGKVEITAEYDVLKYISDTLIYAKKKNKYGILSSKGSVKLPFEFDDMVFQFIKAPEYSLVLKKSKNWFVYTFTDNKYSHECDSIKVNFYEMYYKYYIIKTNNKWGAFSSSRNILPPDYELVEEFQPDPDFLLVTNNRRKALFHLPTNQFITDFFYDIIEYGDRKTLIVSSGNKYGLLDKFSGKVVLPIQYQKISHEYISNDVKRFILTLNNKMGLSDVMGRVLIAVNYDEVVSLDFNMYKIRNNGKWGLLDVKNQFIQTPLVYNEISIRNYNEFVLDGKIYKFIKDKLVELPKF